MLDEISEGLSPVIVEEIGRAIEKLKQRGYTILLVEQNFEFAAGLADRLYVMEHGQIAAHFPASEADARADMLNELIGV
ncbi:urea ABC transporter, ATP-binding protein UrtE [compost metagenome]